MDLIKYMLSLEEQKYKLKAVGLSDAEISTLLDACHKRATTTILPNSDVTLYLLKDAYTSLLSGKKYEEILCEIIDLDWIK